MIRRILASSRYLILIAVLGSFFASIALIFYGGLTTVNILIEVFTHATFTIAGAKHLAVECIEVIDLFLLATVLYIVALGLCQVPPPEGRGLTVGWHYTRLCTPRLD